MLWAESLRKLIHERCGEFYYAQNGVFVAQSGVDAGGKGANFPPQHQHYDKPDPMEPS
jgi:hypothetical protein